MQLKTIEFPFTLLTPCFSGTALGKDAPQAEMRVPPIRGHIRSWHRILCGSENANRVWGSANGNNGSGSRVGLRVSGSPMSSGEKAAILPHKSGGNSGSRPSGSSLLPVAGPANPGLGIIDSIRVEMPALGRSPALADGWFPASGMALRPVYRHFVRQEQ